MSHVLHINVLQDKWRKVSSVDLRIFAACNKKPKQLLRASKGRLRLLPCLPASLPSSQLFCLQFKSGYRVLLACMAAKRY